MIREYTTVGGLKITSVGKHTVEPEVVLFVVDEGDIAKFCIIESKNIKSIVRLIVDKGTSVSLETTMYNVTDEIREYKCYVELKNDSVTLSSELTGELQLTDNLLESFKFMAFLNTVMSE